MLLGFPQGFLRAGGMLYVALVINIIMSIESDPDLIVPSLPNPSDMAPKGVPVPSYNHDLLDRLYLGARSAVGDGGFSMF